MFKRIINFFRRAMLCILSLFICHFAFANECDNWQTQQPDWLWCDGFEDDTELKTRYQDVSTKGLSHSSNDAFLGSQSLEQKYEKGQVDAGWIIRVREEGFPDHLFVRFYHKYGPGFSGSYPQKMARIGFRNRGQTWQEVFRVHLWSLVQSGEPTLDVLARNSTQGPWFPVALSGVSTDEILTMWAAFEIEVKLNTPGQKDGLYRLYINDKLKIERLNIDFRADKTHKINEVMLDTYWNEAAPEVLSRFYDNFVISTKKIGLVNNKKSPPITPTITDISIIKR